MKLLYPTAFFDKSEGFDLSKRKNKYNFPQITTLYTVPKVTSKKNLIGHWGTISGSTRKQSKVEQKILPIAKSTHWNGTDWSQLEAPEEFLWVQKRSPSFFNVFYMNFIRVEKNLMSIQTIFWQEIGFSKNLLLETIVLPCDESNWKRDCALLSQRIKYQSDYQLQLWVKLVSNQQ